MAPLRQLQRRQHESTPPHLPRGNAKASYQGIKHQRVKGLALGVLHHDVEQGVQGVLEKLQTQGPAVSELRQLAPSPPASPAMFSYPPSPKVTYDAISFRDFSSHLHAQDKNQR